MCMITFICSLINCEIREKYSIIRRIKLCISIYSISIHHMSRVLTSFLFPTALSLSLFQSSSFSCIMFEKMRKHFEFFFVF